MTNKEKFKRVIENDFDKDSNYNIIMNKLDKKDNKKIYISILVLIFTIVFIAINANKEILKTFNVIEKNDKIYINDINVVNTFSNTSSSSNENNSSSYINIPYYEILSNLNIPNDFDIKYNGKIKYKNEEINNYEFWFKNSKNNRSIVIGISNKNIPISSININVKNSNKSFINNTELEIYRYNYNYIAKLNYKGFNLNIESFNIKESEFIDLLKSLIKE